MELRKKHRHKKTGKSYWMIGQVMNKTSDSYQMLYQDREGSFYVRELDDWLEKFERVDEDD